MRIKVEAKIHPSEDPEKVREAVETLFPELEIKISDDYLIGKSKDFEALKTFKNKLGLQAIRDSARREFKKSKEGDSLRFFLNRQAATVHKISFSGQDTPLGPIEVFIESEDIDDIIDFLAPGKEKRKSG